MTTLSVRLELPRDLLGALDVAEVHIAGRLRELIALELYREGRISAGKGAELLGLSKRAFVDLLAQQGINYFSESPEELAEQVADLERLLSASGQEDNSR
jgi:predicted HTH domain antitoxin